MRRALKLVLALAALLAFVAQGPAYASTSGASFTDSDAFNSMMMDCADQAAEDQDCCIDCERGLPACISSIGCGMPTVLEPQELSAAVPSLSALGYSRPLAFSLIGRSLKPETHPPIAMI